MKSRKGMVWLAVLIVLALAVFFNRGRIHFDWAIFWMQLRHVSSNTKLKSRRRT